MSDQNFKITSSESIPESSNYFEGRADSIVTVGTNLDGDAVVTFVFLNNYPIIKNDNGTLIVKEIDKRKIASISLANQHARKFYESLKSVFEPTNPR